LIAALLGSEKLPFFDLTDEQTAILFDIRLPRILLGATIGASLAVAGREFAVVVEKSAG
jgi:ABC-type Fe3+-siderophore transport system permease subunit